MTRLPKILILDDSGGEIGLLSHYCLRGIAEIRAEKTRDAALAALRDDPSIDLVLADLDLADGSRDGGLRFVREVRADASIRRVPIAITTMMSGASAEASMDAGADAHLQKPSGIYEIRDAVQALLAKLLPERLS